MPTFVGRITNSQILLLVWVSIPGKPAEEMRTREYSALLDTGAQGTMISEKVVQEVGLEADGFGFIIPVTGIPEKRPKYRIRLDIPIGSNVSLPDGRTYNRPYLRGKEMEVKLLPYAPTNHDVLLGMDLLFGFHLTMFNDMYILSN